MKHLKIFEIKRSIKPIPDKVLPKISVEDLIVYSNAQKIIERYIKILPICAKEYINFHKHEVAEEINFATDYEDFDFDVINVDVSNGSVFIEVEFEDDYAGEIEVTLGEFVDFCNNYEVHVSSKKYNL